MKGKWGNIEEAINLIRRNRGNNFKIKEEEEKKRNNYFLVK